MRTVMALLFIAGGALAVWSAFRTPPDPRIAIGNLLASRPLREGYRA